MCRHSRGMRKPAAVSDIFWVGNQYSARPINLHSVNLLFPSFASDGSFRSKPKINAALENKCLQAFRTKHVSRKADALRHSCARLTGSKVERRKHVATRLNYLLNGSRDMYVFPNHKLNPVQHVKVHDDVCILRVTQCGHVMMVTIPPNLSAEHRQYGMLHIPIEERPGRLMNAMGEKTSSVEIVPGTAVTVSKLGNDTTNISSSLMPTTARTHFSSLFIHGREVRHYLVP